MAEPSRGQQRSWLASVRPHAVSEDIAPLSSSSEVEPDEQETFETGVGLVEPVEEDEAEVWTELLRERAWHMRHVHACIIISASMIDGWPGQLSCRSTSWASQRQGTCTWFSEQPQRAMAMCLACSGLMTSSPCPTSACSRASRSGQCILHAACLQQLSGQLSMRAPLQAQCCAVQELLGRMHIPPNYPKGLAHRAVYCSRTLNLRSIQARRPRPAAWSGAAGLSQTPKPHAGVPAGPDACSLACRPLGTTWCEHPSTILTSRLPSHTIGCPRAAQALTLPPARPVLEVMCALQDYTLIHYDVEAWEGKAYAYGLKYLQDVGCPVGGLRFDPDLVIRGLIVDKELGNLVKVDRFGWVGPLRASLSA